MVTLEDEVLSVVKAFMANDELFTALDVSNKVKMVLPFAKHREVRDVVRGMFNTVIGVSNWSRSPITVTLPDGSTTEALLYHPLHDTWDLNVKYDAQKRTQAAVKLTNKQPPSVPPAPKSVPNATPVVVQVAAQTQAKSLWDRLFDNQPSLFPRK